MTVLPEIRRGKVAVLVPAHNEAEQIADTLQSLHHQTRRPDLILVISDRSTDGTAMIAAWNGARVIETVGNDFKKAGALNAGIQHLIEHDLFAEFIVTIDADTVLDPDFIERSVHVLNYDLQLGGLSAVCQGKRGLGRNRIQRALSWFQRAEYRRAGLLRLRQNIHTLSGAGSVLRADAIYHVLMKREQLYIEREDNLVEDFEATMAIKEAGYTCTNNRYCTAQTDLMVTIPTLMAQRTRWVKGSIDALRNRGWSRITRGSIVWFIYGYLSILIVYLSAGWISYVALQGNFKPQALWSLAVLSAYQSLSLRKMGWKSMLIGAILLPEVAYGLLRHTWLLRSLVRSYTNKAQNWAEEKGTTVCTNELELLSQ